MKEYKAVIYMEGALGSLLLGQSKVDPIKLSSFLNANAAEGWRVVTMDKDQRRMLLFCNDPQDALAARPKTTDLNDGGSIGENEWMAQWWEIQAMR